MHRILSLWLPHWPIDRRWGRRLREGASSAGSERGAPAVRLIAWTRAGVRRIAHACPRALAAGIAPGMTLVEARALLNDEPWVAEDDPGADHRALRRLARWCHRFSPRVAIDPPDGLLLDMTGMHRLVVSEAALAARVMQRIRRLGVTCAGAVAPTPLCAAALARHQGGGGADDAPPPIVPPGGEAAALDPLPVRAILSSSGDAGVVDARRGRGAAGAVVTARAAAESVEIDAAAAALAEVGVQSIAGLRRLPRAELVSRIGGRALSRLDRALGLRADPLEPVPPVESIIVEQPFAGPVRDPAAIEQAVRGLLRDLSDRATRRDLGIRMLQIVLRRADAPPLEIPIRFARPVVCARHMAVIVRPAMERANLGFGVESIRVRVRSAVPLPPVQDALPGVPVDAIRPDPGARTTSHDRKRGELIDRLVARLGDDAVRTMHVTECRAPGHAWTWPRATTSMSAPGTDLRPETARPSRLLARPQPLPILERDADGVPRRIRLGAHARSVVAVDAPEYLSRPWWRVPESESTELEYRRVREEGGRSLWIFRAARSAPDPIGVAGAPVHPGNGDDGGTTPRPDVAQAAWFLHGEWT